MQTNRLILPALLLLAACGPSREKDADERANGVTGNIVEEVVPDNESAKPSTPENVANGVGVEASTKHAIPIAFHGRWGMVPGDCGADASIAKGLMTVDGAQLRFYESVGKPAVVTNPTPSRMEGRFRFTGEGMEWSKDMSLTLQGNGDTLIRTESDPTASYRYKKCAA